MPRVVVAGLGPAGPELRTAQTNAAIDRSTQTFQRTARHPGALNGVASFDDVYDAADSLEDVYASIVERIVAAAANGEVLYLVPGSPLVAERTVELLRGRTDVVVEVLPGLSFLDLAWAALAIDPVAEGVVIVDGQRFAVDAAGRAGPFLVAQCDSAAVLSDVKLAVDDGPDVTVLHHLGLPDQRVETVTWDELDRAVAADHLTSVYVPALAAPVAGEVARFVELVRTLRDRCPWDREQTHATLTRHLVEETYETLDAIAGLPDSYPHLEEELGDLLFQVVFHATLAAEEGEFTMADVARGIHDKLVGRHPHVFGDVDATSRSEVVANWEQIKKAEKGRDSIMDGIPVALPALLYALKVGRKAAAVGFDWDAGDIEGPMAKVTEELDELRADSSLEELGDLLFAVVNVARHLEMDPEFALRAATDKFRARFQAMETLAEARGVAVSDSLWDEVKRTGR
ncbi:MAG TPA: nucleoside triphosphate pyrophosphohydrolase [Acidimicrobiales bacterium]|nr:nucleoside triphosphate pyrophosphohydrolase [Acidimicrobiales bacterium]